MTCRRTPIQRQGSYVFHVPYRIHSLPSTTPLSTFSTPRSYMPTNMRHLFYDHELRGCCDRLRVAAAEEDDGAVGQVNVVSESEHLFCAPTDVSKAHNHANQEDEQNPPSAPGDDTGNNDNEYQANGMPRVVAPGTVSASSSTPRYTLPPTRLHDGRLFRKVG